MSRTETAARVPTLATVLDVIRERVTVSRVELAEATGLTAATITHAIRELIDVGFVHEVGTAASSGGTPRRLLELEPTACYTVGIQLDRFTATGVVVDLAGHIVARSSMAGAQEGEPAEVLRFVADHVNDLLATAAVPKSKVLGVGLATYGPQDRTAGVLLTAQPTASWLEYPLTETLSEALGVPVLIENDATAAAIGEEGLGGARSSFATVYMAGGIGAGVVLGGQPYRGATSNGVELGHISIDAFGPACSCGNRGCVENIAGPTAVVLKANTIPGLADRLRLRGDTVADFERIARAATSGDPDALSILEESAAVLGTATVSLVNLFDVARVVIAGAAFATAGPLYRDAAQAAVDRAAFMRFAHPVVVELSDHVSDAAAIGGAVAVLRRSFEARTARSGAPAGR
ncbi:ROK family transcriptional regulator [Leifsonia sp. SIMBA_070]|uniref:ROK family transcriptional regulator n=1 Tax=Leifsonia sp. SIMBA_070 TaxID=3085810 RepID=UPI00397E0B65